jgi:hypothetical protein
MSNTKNITSNDLVSKYMKHLLITFGMPETYLYKIEFLYKPNIDELTSLCANGKVCVLIKPSSCILDKIAVKQKVNKEILFSREKINLFSSSSIFKTLHSAVGYECSEPRSSVLKSSSDGMVAWFWSELLNKNLLVIGTDLFHDLMRFHQGDENRCGTNNKQTATWGFDSERPMYLYEEQIDRQKPHERYADNWCNLLADTISAKLSVTLNSVLPNNAKGAVIITGDDDQAYLETYHKQQKILRGTPITYFMHPLTKHTKKTITELIASGNVDLGLHPDALDNPEKYAEIFSEQVDWFKNKFNVPPFSVRNHGFLNDGYWGHLNAWLQGDIKFSSNIPGLDGTVLTGSLLPARVIHNNILTDHWSILTAIGDGLIFVNKIDDKKGSEYIYSLADSIRSSQMPGVMVFNLHPQNIELTKHLHYAVLDLIKDGFVPMTIREAHDWFSKRKEPNRDTQFTKWVKKNISYKFHKIFT